MSQKDEIKLMVTIVNRGHSETVVKRLQEASLSPHYVSLGLGTANSEVLDYLGLGETEKDVLFSLVQASQASAIMEHIKSGMSLHLPGKGIIFILPLNAVSKVIERTLASNQTESNLEECETMEQKANYSLVMAIINRGYVDDVMEAATGAGARGGTVIHARGVGHEEVGKFFGIVLQPEKDVVMILVQQKNKIPVMQAISKAAGMLTKAHGIFFSLPVEDFDGIS